jgi:cyclic beta-1,2-glucan synthetase
MTSENNDRILSEAHAVASLEPILRPSTPCTFFSRVDAARHSLGRLEKELANSPAATALMTSEVRDDRAAFLELRANYRFLRSAIFAISDGRSKLIQLPRAVLHSGSGTPRIAALADRYLRAVDYVFSGDTFRIFIETIQAHEPLTLKELWAIPLFLRFSLVDILLGDAQALLNAQGSTSDSISALVILAQIKSLRGITNTDWQFLIEPLIEFDRVLRQDPAGAYSAMDFTTREMYRKRVAFLAYHSDCNESQVAYEALLLAGDGGKETAADPRIHRRHIHVGYYLLDEGFSALAKRVGFHPPIPWRIREVVRANAEGFFIDGILIFTVFLIAAAIFPVLVHFSSMAAVLTAILFLLLPAMQGAVDLVNRTITAFYEPETLPKLKFDTGIPSEFATLVAIPSLLLNEKQVHKLTNDLEVRYLANRDRSLHFVLLTDLADSTSKPNENDSHPLVELAVRLIDALNEKYGSSGDRPFLLLHRHRRFNVRQEVWMGWERKRGKLLDLNKLLAGVFDAFPIKAGPLNVLHQVRYVLTLDSDTQLPRGAAAQLVGAMAHPLNQAVIDPEQRVVTSGYGIMQPRIGITVRSSTRSRLAAIFSGQNGFDIYTRATSDSYQDLFGEGIFTGKGIYEVATLHAVLNNRFPRNSLLSHDLIEGAYARAGLVTDVELIEDYPSHYSAYSRREHRWVRGDWQIGQWMFSHVPDESGHRVSNPVSAVNRWKIFDNLRRSLLDPFLFLLIIAGWLGLPGGALYWTVIPVLLIMFPSFVELLFGVIRSMTSEHKGELGETISGFWRSLVIALLHLVLLPHKTLLALDAITRSLVRRFITGKRLLEWETAAQAESEDGAGSTPVDRYLALVPLFTIGIAALVWFFSPHHRAILVAAPLLALWLIGVQVAAWLNRSPHPDKKVTRDDKEFLQAHALRIWRYFHQFGVEGHNYLIPDNVEEEGAEAARVSPTNIGLLLNARQAAYELGFLTAPEFADLTVHSLATIVRLEKFRGHLYNWYDTKTLQPLDKAPFVSTVDSGNFVASLYTLHAGTLDLLDRPLIEPRLWSGLRAHLHMLRTLDALPPTLAKLSIPNADTSITEWAGWLLSAQTAIVGTPSAKKGKPGSGWWLAETQNRIAQLRGIFRDYLPWMLPEYKSLRAPSGIHWNEEAGAVSIHDALLFAEALGARLSESAEKFSSDTVLSQLSEQLLAALRGAVGNLRSLADSLRTIAREAERIAEETEFAFLVDPDRQILSIGYEMAAQKRHQACYDMIASEARISTFLAIARGDLLQQSWFKLSRDHVHAFGRFLLLSWSGTMFEYLMPALWTRSFPGTLLANTQSAVVHVQRAFAEKLGLPWGISESGSATRNDSGHYHYFAYGIPDISAWGEASAGPVISPYSTFLALGIDAPASIQNLRRMESSKWMGDFGLYEAVDYTASRRSPSLVKEWMAHHQGMSLLAITNLLCGDIVQRWFHANALVQATELLLHETPVKKSTLRARMKELAPLGAGN